VTFALELDALAESMAAWSLVNGGEVAALELFCACKSCVAEMPKTKVKRRTTVGLRGGCILLSPQELRTRVEGLLQHTRQQRRETTTPSPAIGSCLI
jgi:hypothetical protein